MSETIYPLKHPESHADMVKVVNMPNCWLNESTAEVYKQILIERMNLRSPTGEWLPNEDTDWFVLLTLAGFAEGWA